MQKQELEKFLYYMLDKVEECYKKEVENAVKEFLRETAQEVPVQEQPQSNDLDYLFSGEETYPN